MLKFGQNEQNLFFEFESLPEIFKTSKREERILLDANNHSQPLLKTFRKIIGVEDYSGYWIHLNPTGHIGTQVCSQSFDEKYFSCQNFK